MKLQIKTLSPLHIGNGEKYNGLSYIQDRRKAPIKLCYLEFDALQKTLTPQQLKQFGDWVIIITEREPKRYPNLYRFLKDSLNDRNNSLSNRLISKSLYQADLLFREDPSQKRFLGNIDAFIKQNNKIYIPGAEIKGAIRTAIFYTLLNKNSKLWENNHDWQNKIDAGLSNLIKKITDFGTKHSTDIDNVKDKRLQKWMKNEKRIKEKVLVREMGDIEKKLQEELFRSSIGKDAKYDLLKFIHIADTELKEPSHCLFVSDLITLNISRSFPTFQELCKKGEIFTSDLRLENNEKVLNQLGFTEEQKWVVSDINNVFQCCYEFSKRLLDEEISYFQSQNKTQIVQKLQAIQKKNTPQTPVIRIGKNEGYLSLTMGLLVKDKDPTLYNNVLCHATKNTSYTGNFPKTRRIVNLPDGQDTLGWVQLSI